MKVHELIKLLESCNQDADVSFCIGEAISYGIERVYEDDETVWLDNQAAE